MPFTSAMEASSAHFLSALMSTVSQGRKVIILFLLLVKNKSNKTFNNEIIIYSTFLDNNDFPLKYSPSSRKPATNSNIPRFSDNMLVSNSG